MFAVIYRGYLKSVDDKEVYRKAWHTVAAYFVAHRGALGSCLHKTEEGMWLAYSRWPDKATRDASWRGCTVQRITARYSRCYLCY